MQDVPAYQLSQCIHYAMGYYQCSSTWGSPLRSSGQSFQRSGFDSRRYHISREVVGLERGLLSLVSTTEELLGGKKSSGSGLKIREYGRRASVTLTTWHSLSSKDGNNFADKRRSLGQYSSLAD
jgi:hypothetical protein